MVEDTEDALTAVWPVAGGNRGVWNEAAAAAGSDMYVSQETVGGLLLGLQRWMAAEILRKTLARQLLCHEPILWYDQH